MSDNTNDKNIYDGDEFPPNEALPQDDVETPDSITEETDYSKENAGSLIIEDDIVESINNDSADNEVYSEEIIETQEEYTNKKSNLLKRLVFRVTNVISDIKAAEPGKRIKIISLYSVCILLVVFILTDIIPILPNAYNRFYVGNNYVIGETQGGVYDKIGKGVIYAGNGSILSFEPDMTCNFKYDSVVGTPKLETSGKNAVVYYMNSNEAVVIKDDDNIEKIEMNEIITGATVCKNGYYGFVTDESGYKSCVNVFNKNGKSVYKWHTNNPVLDISISENGKNMTAASYTYESNAMSGKLVFFDMNNSNPVKEVVTGSNVFSEVKYINNDVVVAFGDMYTAAYTFKGVMKWRIDYGGRTLKSYDISDDGDIAFIFDRYSSEMSESTVELYNSSGRLTGKYESKDNVKYVSANNGRFLLSLDRQTILLDDDADVMKRRTTEKDFRRAVLYHNYNFAFSVSDSVAEILSVNH